MAGRAFVMVPLAELAPELMLQGKKTVELAEELRRVQSIARAETC
jgi:7,8-dihydro-6-hydroxymethylpterin-pyrophosphokinase